MKAYLSLLVATLLFSTQLYAQGPDWKWAVTAGGWDIACDKDGNVYLTGFVAGSIDIGSTVLTSQSGEDIYLVKYDAAGNLQWAKLTGGNSNERAYSLALDGAGNIYLSGSMHNAAANPEFGGLPLTSYGNMDMLLAKYDNSGNLLWARTTGGPGNDSPVDQSIAIDNFGNVLVTGTFDNYCVFGSNTLYSAGDEDILLVKYNSSGDVLWYTGAGGTTSDMGHGVTTDVSGNVFLTGYYMGTAAFGSLQLVAPDALAHTFVAKYDAAGLPQWVKTSHGTYCSGIAVDGSGAIYMAGANNPAQETFVGKFDNAGTPVWIKHAGEKTAYPMHMDIDPAGNLYFSNDSIIAAKYDNAGNLMWKAMNIYPDNFAMLTADKYGNVYVSGDINSGSIHFGTHTAPPPHYLAKLSPFPASVPVLFNGIDMTLYPNPSTGLLLVDGIDFSGYTVTDMTGRRLLFDDKAKNTDAIDVRSLPAGNYLLHLQTAGKSTSLNFTKQ